MDWYLSLFLWTTLTPNPTHATQKTSLSLQHTQPTKQSKTIV